MFSLNHILTALLVASASTPFQLLKDDNAEDDNNSTVEKTDAIEDTTMESPNDVSAADYDPSMDRIKELRHTASETDLLKSKDHQEKVSEGIDSQADMLASDYTEKLEKPSVINQMTEIDMFSDNLDMFAAATDIKTGQNALLSNMAAATNPSLTDNWDDAEGYYCKYRYYCLILYTYLY